LCVFYYLRAESFYLRQIIFVLLYDYICTEMKLLNNFSNPVQLLIKKIVY